MGGYRWDALIKGRLQDKKCLEMYGYKTYSQNDEDGIIEEIFDRVGTTNKTFIEFGVEDGLECNSHLLLHKGWNGLWIEGSEDSVNSIRKKFRPVLKNGRLKVINAFITRDNINDLFQNAGVTGSIDLLSIDVDGNDWYIFDAICSKAVVCPRVIITEYNGKFPPSVNWKMAYDKNHIWPQTDWHGASLKAFEELGLKYGYQLVGTNINGANAFFVKKELCENKFAEPATAEHLYTPLRLDIIHKNGHPADVFLGNQRENYGFFDYDDSIVRKQYGFFENEKDGEGNEWAWMSGKSAAILVNKQIKGSKVFIPYHVPELSNPIKAVVSIDGIKTNDILDTDGEIEVDISRAEEPLMVEIDLNRLWSPADEADSDGRKLGIQIKMSEIRVQ